jgi:hypothetical protein
MGEKRASGEGMLVGFIGEEAFCVGDAHLLTTQNTVNLQSFYADNLKYFQSKPFGYNKCKFSLTLEAALMIKSTNGEKKYGC